MSILCVECFFDVYITKLAYLAWNLQLDYTCALFEIWFINRTMQHQRETFFFVRFQVKCLRSRGCFFRFSLLASKKKSQVENLLFLCRIKSIGMVQNECALARTRSASNLQHRFRLVGLWHSGLATYLPAYKGLYLVHCQERNPKHINLRLSCIAVVQRLRVGDVQSSCKNIKGWRGLAPETFALRQLIFRQGFHQHIDNIDKNRIFNPKRNDCNVPIV